MFMLKLSFILKKDTNFTPSELMYKKAKELPNVYKFYYNFYGTSFIVYEDKSYLYDYYIVENLSNNKQRITLVLKEWKIKK